MKLRQAGLSYVELLVAVLLIVVALVPMLDALRPGLQGAQIHRERAEINFALAGKLETLLTESFADLDAAATAAGAPTNGTSYSDAGAPVPHEVFVWRYDVDNADADNDVFTGGEPDLLWLRVATPDGAHALESLLSPY